jgi:hypothetical protein
MCDIRKYICKFAVVFSMLISFYINSYPQFSQTPVKLTFGNDRNPSFHLKNDNYDLSRILFEFLAYERVNGSAVNVCVSKINTNGAVDSGTYLTNNSFINVNPSIGYYIPGYSANEILNSIVVWETNKNSNKDIYARIYKQNQGWLSEFSVDSSDGDQTATRIAIVNQNIYAVVYKSVNDIKLKLINVDNQSIILDTNLTSGISENCKNPYLMISPGNSKKLFVSFEREYSSSRNSVYCLKADTITNPLVFMIDTVRFSGYSYNEGFALINYYLCIYESYMNGKRNVFGTEIKWNGQSSVHYNILTSSYFDMWGYKGSEFILGDNSTNGVYAFLTKVNNSVYVKAKMGWFTGDSVNALVSNDTNIKSNISISTANSIPNSACYRFWIAFEKNLSPADRGIYGISFTSCAMNIKKLTGIPAEYSLQQNYPNPFNPVTKIRYDIPFCHSGVGRGYPLAGHLVKLIIFDALGREVETLMNERQSAGSYEAVWDGTRFASGVYFYRLTAEGYGETKRMILIR